MDGLSLLFISHLWCSPRFQPSWRNVSFPPNATKIPARCHGSFRNPCGKQTGGMHSLHFTCLYGHDLWSFDRVAHLPLQLWSGGALGGGCWWTVVGTLGRLIDISEDSDEQCGDDDDDDYYYYYYSSQCFKVSETWQDAGLDERFAHVIFASTQWIMGWSEPAKCIMWKFVCGFSASKSIHSAQTWCLSMVWWHLHNRIDQPSQHNYLKMFPWAGKAQPNRLPLSTFKPWRPGTIPITSVSSIFKFHTPKWLCVIVSLPKSAANFTFPNHISTWRGPCKKPYIHTDPTGFGSC